MKTKLFIAIALFAIIGIAFIGCDNSNDTPPPDFDQHVALAGDDVVGGKLTATITGTGGKDGPTVKIGDKAGATYDIGFGDAGKSIKATAAWSNGTAESAPITVKTPTLDVTLEESDETNDGLYVGEKLTMVPTVGNVKDGLNPGITYTWKVGNDTVGSGKELTVTDAYADKTITGTAQLTDYTTAKASKDSSKVKKLDPNLPTKQTATISLFGRSRSATVTGTMTAAEWDGVADKIAKQLNDRFEAYPTAQEIYKEIFSRDIVYIVEPSPNGYTNLKTIGDGKTIYIALSKVDTGYVTAGLPSIYSNDSIVGKVTPKAIQPTHDNGWQRLTAAKIRNGNRIARHMSRGQRLV